jgi:hypothetical protein
MVRVALGGPPSAFLQGTYPPEPAQGLRLEGYRHLAPSGCGKFKVVGRISAPRGWQWRATSVFAT